MVVDKESERSFYIEPKKVMGEERKIWAYSEQRWINGDGHPIIQRVTEGYTKEDIDKNLSEHIPQLKKDHKHNTKRNIQEKGLVKCFKNVLDKHKFDDKDQKEEMHTKYGKFFDKMLEELNKNITQEKEISQEIDKLEKQFKDLKKQIESKS